MIGGVALHNCQIAEMATGEGKTLVATLPIYLNSITNRTVVLVTVNDYLAQRDANWMGPLYKNLGMSVSSVVSGQSPEDRQKSYSSNVIYATNRKISQERLEEINQRTRDGGAEIVKYLEKGSAFYAPAASGVQMAEAYLKDEKKLLPCAIQLNGEYGVSNVYAGVPVIIGKDGVEKIEQIDLDEKEKKEFMHSIDAVKALWEAASKIDPDLSK